MLVALWPSEACLGLFENEINRSSSTYRPEKCHGESIYCNNLPSKLIKRKKYGTKQDVANENRRIVLRQSSMKGGSCLPRITAFIFLIFFCVRPPPLVLISSVSLISACKYIRKNYIRKLTDFNENWPIGKNGQI